MSDSQEFLWRMHSAHISSALHYETQRSTVATLILSLATGLIALITYDDVIDRADRAAAAFLLVLGVFGALFAYKHHERFRLHVERAKAYRDALDATLVGAPLKAIKDTADEEHNKRYRRWRRVKAFLWWVILNLFVGVLGGYLLLAACGVI